MAREKGKDPALKYNTIWWWLEYAIRYLDVIIQNKWKNHREQQHRNQTVLESKRIYFMPNHLKCASQPTSIMPTVLLGLLCNELC